jgi:Ca-activated chloride channel homolog
MKPLTLLDERETLGCIQVCDEPGLGALRTARGNLPLKLVDVEAHVVGLFVETTLRQTYVNTLGVPLEATYVFPLPDRAAVTRFRLEVGERVVEGELQERGQARRTYDQAMRAGHRAAITEEERPGVFTMRVGNLMPGDEATVWLTIVGPLPFADGEATFQFPLVVAPRYIPGSALGGEQAGDGVAHDTDAVPDASRISPPVLLPGFPSPVRLSISVHIDPAGLPLGAVRSSLHAVSSRASCSTATSSCASAWAARRCSRP